MERRAKRGISLGEVIRQINDAQLEEEDVRLELM